MTYSEEHGLFHNDCNKKLPNFSFIMPNTNNDDIEYTLEPEFYAVYDEDEKQCGVIMNSIEGDDTIILGGVFMRKYYSTFIYGDDLHI